MLDDDALAAAARMRPLVLEPDELRQMTDADLLALLSSGGDARGTLYASAAQAVTAELLRRQIERGAKPHWSVIPSFWLLVVSVVLALAALLR